MIIVTINHKLRRHQFSICNLFLKKVESALENPEIVTPDNHRER